MDQRQEAVSFEIPGYTDIKPFAQGKYFNYYQGIEEETHRAVLMKVSRVGEADHSLAQRLAYEFKVLQNVDIEGVPHALALENLGPQTALIFEAKPGLTLDRYMKETSPSLTEILTITLRLVNIVGKVHRAGIIHKDIKPENILIELTHQKVTLLDFSFAQKASIQADVQEGEFEGSLYYMAPEQTGRINRHIDYRSDYYALGATLYELLSGQKVFEGSAIELVQAHLLKEPKDLTTINPKVPYVLNQIVMKLLAKSPEDRYQSSHAIKKDLEACLKMLEAGEIKTFPIASGDVPERFTLSQKMYGREALVHKIDQLLHSQQTTLWALFIVGK